MIWLLPVSSLTVVGFLSALLVSSVLGNPNLAAELLLNGLVQSDRLAYTKVKANANEHFCYTDLVQGQWKAYEPVSCQYLRQSAGVSEQLFQSNIAFDELECLSSDSKSGQAFWRSRSGIVVVKTIKQYECRTMRRMLKSYCNHVQSGQSCIGNVLGLYRVKLNRGRKYYFLVTKNVYHQGPSTKITPSLKFDLKGSTIGRRKSASSTVHKDLDLMNSGELLSVGPVAKDILLSALYRDSQFLASYNIMDYSLLVEVEEPNFTVVRRFLSRVFQQPLSTAPSDRGKLVMLGTDGKVYHFGIIDFLQA